MPNRNFPFRVALSSHSSEALPLRNAEQVVKEYLKDCQIVDLAICVDQTPPNKTRFQVLPEAGSIFLL